MATWVRNGTGTSPSALDADAPLTGNVSLDNATAPGDFDPAGVTSVRIQWRLAITGSLSDDIWDDHQETRLSNGATLLAAVNDTNTNRTATGNYDKDLTDNSPLTNQSTATWEGAVLSPPTTPDPGWTDIAKSKGWDGSTATIPVANVTVTITYTPATPSRAATLNTGGGITATVTADHSVAASVRTGGNITTTVARPNFGTSIVDLGMVASEPYVDAVDVYIRWRVSSASLAGAGSNLSVAVRENTTERASNNWADIASTSFQTSFFSLTPAEAAAITSWSSLRVRILFTKNAGSGYGYVEVSDVWFSIPAAAAGGNPERTGELNTGGGITATFNKDATRTGTIRSGGGITATVAKRATVGGFPQTGGGISAVASGEHDTQGTVRGGGSITAAIFPENPFAVEINTGGGIDATVTRDVQASVSLNTGGGIAAVAGADKATSGEVNTGGGIAATTTRTMAKTGSIRSGGGITATTSKRVSVSASCNGGGGIEAVASTVRVVPTGVSGGGGVSAVVAGDHSSLGVVNTGGRILASIGANVQTSGVINGGGGIAATTTPDHSSSATVSTGGGITGAVTPNHATSGSVRSGGGITASVSKRGSQSAAVRGGGGISAQVSATKPTTGLTRGGGGIAAVVSGDHATAGTVNGGGGINAATGSDLSTSGVINGGGGIAATVSGDHATSDVVNGGGGITSSATHQAQASGQVRGGGGINPSITPSHASAVTMSTGGGITASATATITPEVSASIRGGGGITATATQPATDDRVYLAYAPADNPGSNKDQPHTWNIRYASQDGSNTTLYAELFANGSPIRTEVLVTNSVTPVDYSYTIPQAIVDTLVALDWYSNFTVTFGLKTSVVQPLPPVPPDTNARVYDTWLEIPLAGDPVREGSLSSGGGITASVTATHIVEAFPSPGNAMLGPAMQTGGGIDTTASTIPERAGELNTGGGVSASTNHQASVAVTMSTGGRILASTADAVVAATVQTGGGITPAYDALRSVAVSLNTGGGINPTYQPVGEAPPDAPGPGRVVPKGPPPWAKAKRNRGGIRPVREAPGRVRPQNEHPDVEDPWR